MEEAVGHRHSLEPAASPRDAVAGPVVKLESVAGRVGRSESTQAYLWPQAAAEPAERPAPPAEAVELLLATARREIEPAASAVARLAVQSQS